MRRKFSLVGAGLVAVAAITMTLIVAFQITRHGWYDTGLKLPEQVSFWNEALVAYGTLALAVVTVASVWETQKVVHGEDLRFRQTRMPMLKVVNLRTDEDNLRVTVENVGDGPARNITLHCKAHVTWRWNEDGLADNRDKLEEADYDAEAWPMVSYLEPKANDDILLPQVEGDPRDALIRVNVAIQIDVSFMAIGYYDAFEDYYETEYSRTDVGFNPRRFTWRPPDKLLRSNP